MQTSGGTSFYGGPNPQTQKEPQVKDSLQFPEILGGSPLLKQ